MRDWLCNKAIARPMAFLMAFFVLCSLLFVSPPARAQSTPKAPQGKVSVKLFWLWFLATRGGSPTDPLIKLMKDSKEGKVKWSEWNKQHAGESLPEIDVQEWSGLSIPGSSGRSQLLLGIAGNSAPDLYYSWFHIVRNDVSQGFVMPINKWIGDDTNHNGLIDDNECTRYPEWKQIEPLVRQVITVPDPITGDAKVYGLPKPVSVYMGIMFRQDLVRQAGLNPNNPPKTWDEFFYWCQKLTDPKNGRWGFGIPEYGFTWLPWLNSSIDDKLKGPGTPIIQYRTSPKTGKVYPFPMEATTFTAPDTKEDLTAVKPRWEAAWSSSAGRRSVEFFHKLRWQPWIKDPKTNEPINLQPADVANGTVKLKDGREITFSKDDVIEGVTRPWGGNYPDVDVWKMLARGEVASVEWYYNDMQNLRSSGVNPDLLGVMPIPADAEVGGHRVVQLGRHYAVMTEGVARRPEMEQEVVWQTLKAYASLANNAENIRTMVMSGNAKFVNPNDLVRFGFKEYVREVPQSVRTLYKDVDRKDTDPEKIIVRTEPFMGLWDTMSGELTSSVIGIALSASDTGKNFSPDQIAAALESVQKRANEGTMFKMPEERIAKYRPLAWTIFFFALALLIFFVVMIVQTNLRAAIKGGGSRAGVYAPWMPWLMLLPALGLIAVWGYYPLVRGATMAFQNYNIIGPKPWTGMDNFINIFLNEDFIKVYCWRTLVFVFWNLLLVFTTPIILAILLAEIPRGKVFWRSVFFLPQLTSGLVIMLLWKLMYNSSDTGMLNQVMAFFNHLFHHSYKANDWLGDPKLAMVCTIIPSVWAGMGISSLIYLAALKGIPEELYEAADLDGAGAIAKLSYITIPQLMPLIIINFVGAFIATFQSMGNIFVLTFGGPAKSTMVMGMAIWIEAYQNLRFSIATSMAWIMGTALIGLAYLQIRILRKVEFRRVEEV